jgi:outer membrane protein OmpA-like peptidoglycan-associated protein
MQTDDQTKASFNSTTDLTKQLITLGTAVLTLEVAFASAFFKQGIPRLYQLQCSWGFLLLSIVAGIWVLMAITGSLASMNNLEPKSVYAANIRTPSFVQVVSFAFGMVFTFLYGISVLAETPPSTVSDKTKTAANDAFKGAPLTPDEIRRLTELAVNELASDMAQDAGGETTRKIDEWVQAANSPTTSPGELAKKAAAIRPAIERALNSAIDLAGFPAEKTKAAKDVVVMVGKDLLSGAAKALGGEVAKDAYHLVRKMLVGYPDKQKVPATCNCSPCAPCEKASLPPPPQVSTVTVYFRTNQSSVEHETQREQIWRARALYQQRPSERRLIVRAFTDTTGSATRNARLAMLRAESVRKALIEVDVPETQIEFVPIDTGILPVPVIGRQHIPSNRVVIVEIK